MKVVKRKDITEITLLSIEEYRAAKDNIPSSDYWWWSDWWWLRSPGINSYCVACVAPDGGVLDCGYYILDVIGVRPALRIHPKSLNLKIREKVRLGDFTWTYISEGLLLCDSIIKKMPFRKDWKAKDANVYEMSDIKTYLDRWIKDHTEGQTEKATGEEPRVNTKKELNTLAVENITLLSIEEYRATKDNIPPLDEWWWLRSPGFHSFDAACVVPGGVFGVSDDVLGGSVGVRPALRINPKSLDLQIGDKVQFNGRTWTYIIEGILLCNEIICKMPFRRNWRAKDANDYEKSDIKKFVESWFAAAKITTQP